MRRNRLAMEIAAEIAKQRQSRFLRIVATLLVHDRPEELTGEACPCCGSVDAEISERRDLADIVIDTLTGQRHTRSSTTAAKWTKYVDMAERHEIPIRCPRSALEMLLDDTGRHLFASGGHRAGKTTLGLVWMALQILMFGGLMRRFWLVASTEKKAFELLEKLFRPTPGKYGVIPPILPAVLIASSPRTHRASNKLTTLIDGSIIDLRAFHGDPGAERLKGDPIVAALVDEAAHLPSEASISALRGRCIDLAGRLWFASTAIPSSHVKPLVDKIMEWQRLPADHADKISGAHEGAAYRLHKFRLIDNPWIPLEGLLKEMRTVDMTKAENQRDYEGEWASSEGLCWPNFIDDPQSPARHVIAHEARTVGALLPRVLAEHRAGGHVDITERIARGLFGKQNPHYKPARASNFRFIIGQDVNLNPMSSAILQVTAPADQLDNRDAWHYWILDTVSTTTSNSLAHSERLVSTELARVLDPLGSGSPLKGCGVIMDKTSIANDSTASKYGQSGNGAETFWRNGLDARAPLYRVAKDGKTYGTNGEVAARFSLVHRLINEGRFHVFSRAGHLLNAFAIQLATPDGIVPLDARRGRWDVVMGPMDAATYAVLAAANVKAPTIIRDWASLPG